MSLITIPTIEKTAAELAAESVLTGTNDSFTQRLATRRVLWETVWANPREGATPQAIVDAMGTNAVLIFTASTLDAQFFAALAAAMGTTVEDLVGVDNVQYLSMPPGWTATPNNDGTVSLSYTEP